MLENGSDACSCKKVKCVRYGLCKECVEYHKRKDQKPYCKRTKGSFLKSVFKLGWVITCDFPWITNNISYILR